MRTQTEGQPATGGSPAADPEAEREIDLRRVWEGIQARWWIVVVGMVAGIVLGGVYSLSGGGVYEATARIAPAKTA